VRLVDAEGEQVGVVPLEQAMAIADDAGMDLVEVAPGADPPVCRVMDYGKYKYQLAKKAQEAKKRQSFTQVKEVKMRPKIEDHDFGFKMRNARKFLGERDRVKITIQFRGREIAYTNLGVDLLERVIEELSDIGQPDGAPRREGRFMHVFISPK
jgi:translation initiation factor IF-3